MRCIKVKVSRRFYLLQEFNTGLLENIANISGTEPKRGEHSSHHLKATERLSQILNSLSISNYAEAENRILQLEKENLALKSRIGELEKGENNSEVEKLQHKMNKLMRKEEKYRTQINLLIERIEYLNGNAHDIKAQCKRYKSDRGECKKITTYNL